LIVLVVESPFTVAAVGDAVTTSELATSTVPGLGCATMTFAVCVCTPLEDAVIVADPTDATAVTSPDALTVATAGLLDVHVTVAPATGVPDC
jgi:hypothetical protein